MSTDEPLQLSMFGAGQTNRRWPAHDRFPTNAEGQAVRDVVWPDLRSSSSPLIVTGYMSLGLILDFLAAGPLGQAVQEPLRIMLGHEPTPTTRTTFPLRAPTFEREIADYWLGEGISLYRSAEVLLALDLLDAGRVLVRISADPHRPVHAKIFKGDDAVTLGSSNFSAAGMQRQIEANVRFTRAEGVRFEEQCMLAERIWEQGCDYTAGFRALLHASLQTVDWETALGRACGEVLDGAWARKYTAAPPLADALPLWPSQVQGIAQAMWVLENVGSVLIADATGSGKTRLGAHLMRAAMQRIWSSGRTRQDVPLLICPASVLDNWKRALLDAGLAAGVFSDGSLSNNQASDFEGLLRTLRHAQVLAVDEGHRFMNKHTQRTQRIFNNMADHVLLFTATPINRGLPDLLAIVDLLGADNFGDEVLDILVRITQQRTRIAQDLVSEQDRQQLHHAIQQFTVRRTKSALNEMIDAAPDQYRDQSGRQCRYPEHVARIYRCPATADDDDLAHEIQDLAAQLCGLSRLQVLIMPDWLRRSPATAEEAETRYLQWRLKGASGLAMYNVREALRSSRAALVEHILGTEVARSRFQIPRAKNMTGAIVQTLTELAGRLPPTNLGIELPAWLRDPAAHAQACAEEITLYKRIVDLACRISPRREEAKTAHLLALLEAHSLVLAFDSHPLTLLDLHARLEMTGSCRSIVATGQEEAGRRRVRELARLGSSATRVIALCSDSMAEGLNLQGASAVVHLDMPSVIRQAEQRVGRVDRLDSPHARIEVYWPEDSPAFALRTDERFYARHQEVAFYLGANIAIPTPGKGEIVAVPPAIEEYEAASPADWDEIRDAFAPVRGLVSGGQALVPAAVYSQVRGSQARVISSVSIVAASTPWAFFAVAGSVWGAPRWVYLDSLGAEPLTTLNGVVDALRARLATCANRQYDSTAGTLLAQFLDRLRSTERLLLPRKKQQALHEMTRVLKQYRRAAIATGDSRRELVTRTLLNLLPGRPDEETADLSALAECWLDLIRPVWYQRLTEKRRSKRPLRLRDIYHEVVRAALPTEVLEAIWSVTCTSALWIAASQPRSSACPTCPGRRPRAGQRTAGTYSNLRLTRSGQAIRLDNGRPGSGRRAASLPAASGSLL